MAGPNIPLANLIASISGDPTPLYRTLGQVKGSLSNFASGAGIGGAAVFGGLAIGAGLITKGLFDSALAAADLRETLSKDDQVFGDSSGIVKGTADDLADRFGIVKQVTLDAAANIGLIGKAAGLT